MRPGSSVNAQSWIIGPKTVLHFSTLSTARVASTILLSLSYFYPRMLFFYFLGWSEAGLVSRVMLLCSQPTQQWWLWCLRKWITELGDQMGSAISVLYMTVDSLHIRIRELIGPKKLEALVLICPKWERRQLTLFWVHWERWNKTVKLSCSKHKKQWEFWQKLPWDWGFHHSSREQYL